jgi:hypothetical protein
LFEFSSNVIVCEIEKNKGRRMLLIAQNSMTFEVDDEEITGCRLDSDGLRANFRIGKLQFRITYQWGV